MKPRETVYRYYSKERDKSYVGKNVKLGRNIKIDVFSYIGNDCVIGDNARLGFGVYIGDGCIIGHNTEISANSVLYSKTLIGCWSNVGANCTFRGNTSIGNFVTVYPSAYLGYGLVVEDYVFIGPRLTCTNTRNIRHGRGRVELTQQPARIKFGARIGGGVTLLPGVIIGREALVGAGSVVTRSVCDFKVAYGNPAREVKEIDESQKVSESIYKDYIKRLEKQRIHYQGHKFSFLNAARIVATEIFYWFFNIS